MICSFILKLNVSGKLTKFLRPRFILYRNHYIDYLGLLCFKNNVDPLPLLEEEDLRLVIRRDNLQPPKRRAWESDEYFKRRLSKVTHFLFLFSGKPLHCLTQVALHGILGGEDQYTQTRSCQHLWWSGLARLSEEEWQDSTHQAVGVWKIVQGQTDKGVNSPDPSHLSLSQHA